MNAPTGVMRNVTKFFRIARAQRSKKLIRSNEFSESMELPDSDDVIATASTDPQPPLQNEAVTQPHSPCRDTTFDPVLLKLHEASGMIGELEVDTDDKCFRFDSQMRGDHVWSLVPQALDIELLLNQIVTNLGALLRSCQQAHEAIESLASDDHIPMVSQLMHSLQQRVVLYIQSKFQFIDGIPYHQDQVELLMFIDEPQIAEMKYWLHIVDQVALSIFLSLIIIWLL